MLKRTANDQMCVKVKVTERRRCSSVSALGSVGLSALVPRISDVICTSALLPVCAVSISASEVRTYVSTPDTHSVSRDVPSGPSSMSNTEKRSCSSTTGSPCSESTIVKSSCT